MFSLIERLLHIKMIRYLISGGMGACVHIGIVYVLTHVLSVWYQYATTLGFLCAVGISFTLQKFFTFQDGRTNMLATQSSLFFIIATVNLGINNGLMYLFVDHLSFLPVIAQICTALILAVWSFVLYSKLFTASPRTPEEKTTSQAV